MHKLITLFLLKKNFGNYCCLKKRCNTIIDKKFVERQVRKKYTLKLNEIDSIRGLRYFGPSKMSLLNLTIHSFSIIAVFKYNVFLRSTLMIITLSLLAISFGQTILAFQILIVFFNLVIFIVSMRENSKSLLESNLAISNIDEIIH